MQNINNIDNIDNIDNIVLYEDTNKSYDIVFSFDTTYSMNSCLIEVRKNLSNLISRLFNDIKNLRIGVITHGDYDTEEAFYLMKKVDLTDDKSDLINFVENTPVINKFGKSPAEAYEYVLNKSRELQWKADNKILVIIGDQVPHAYDSYLNKFKLNWKDEVNALKSMKINIYGVQCLKRDKCNYFYESIAKMTNGYYLKLSEFYSISDLILTVCYKQINDEEVEKYEREMLNEGRMTNGMRRVVDVILNRNINNQQSDYVNVGNVVAAEPSWDGARFDVLNINNNCTVKSFMKTNSIDENSGDLYCEITKPITITSDQSVICMNKNNNNIYEGIESKKILFNKKNFVGKKHLPLLQNYHIFMKCNSIRTKLMQNTKLLYEKKDAIVI
jgi:hypothetical protein